METQGQNKVRVLIADDAAVIRKAIRMLLESEPAIEVCGEAVSFSKTLESAAELKPDVILLDLHMPDGGKFKPNAVRQFLSASRVLAMSLSQEDETVTIAESYGAATLLDKANLTDELVPAILRFRPA